MKAFIFFILALLFSLQVFATAQVMDRLIYKGDTIRLFPSPLERHPNIDSLRLKMFDGKADSWRNSTACGNNYLAVWTITDNQLYLTNIYLDCKITNKDNKNLLKLLFGEKYVNGKVKADWVTGTFTSPQGKLLYSINDAYEPIYERDLEFYFEKGKLKKTLLYDNSKAKQSVYSQDEQKRIEHIYSNINWKVLPKRDTIVRVVVEFSANENGIIDEAKILRGYNELYDQEAIRIVKSIPEWDVYFRRGKFKRMSYTMPITFSEENRLIYKK